MSNENEIMKLEHDEVFSLKKTLLYGTDGSNAIPLKTNNIGELVIDTTNLDARYVLKAGDTMTGSLIIATPDGTVDPLFQILTTGTNQYGLDVGTYDLTGIGYGKLVTITGRSNGAIGDGILGIESGLLLGDAEINPLFGQSMGFLQESTSQTMLITADWNYSGANHRMVFNDDILFQQDLEVSGNLSLETLTIGLGSNTDVTLNFNTSGVDSSIKYYSTGRYDFTSGTIEIEDVIAKRGTNQLQNINFIQSAVGGTGIRYDDYNGSVGAYGTYISHEFRHLATNIHNDAYAMRFLNMNDPGYMFGVKSRGSLELGSTTGTDTDISITFNGGVTGNHGLFTWKFNEDYFLFDDDIMLATTEKIYFRDTAIGIYSQADTFLDLFADGGIRIGDSSAGVPTNYANFAPDGELTLAGTARVTKRIWLSANGLKAPGSKPATFVEYGLTGVWRFSDAVAGNEEAISGTLVIPADMDITAVPSFRIGWSADGASPGNCEWQLEYLWISANEATNGAAQETLTVTSTASGTSNGLVFAIPTGIDLPSGTDVAFFFRVTRLSASGNDTITDDVDLRGMNFIYTADSLGIAT